MEEINKENIAKDIEKIRSSIKGIIVNEGEKNEQTVEEAVKERLAIKPYEFYEKTYDELGLWAFEQDASMIEESMKKDIEKKKRILSIIEGTQTPQEAYFNIMDHRSLLFESAYVQYAASYAIETVKKFLEDYQPEMFELSLERYSDESFPSVLLTIKSDYWKYFSKIHGRNMGGIILDAHSKEEISLDSLVEIKTEDYQKSKKNIEYFLSTLEEIEKELEEASKWRLVKSQIERMNDALTKLNHQTATNNIAHWGERLEIAYKRIQTRPENEEEIMKKEFRDILEFIQAELGYPIIIQY